MGAQVISTVQDSAELAASDLPLKYIVTGKTWNCKNEEPLAFIEDRPSIAKELESGKLVFKGERQSLLFSLQRNL